MIDTGRWENTQAKKDAQIANPNTSITPATTPQDTPQFDPMTTSDPSNGGITPTVAPASGFDIDKLNQGLSAANFGNKNTGTLAGSYGINNGGSSFEETQGMKEVITDPTGETYYKETVKRSNQMDETKRTKFVEAMNGIDISKKVANSGAAIKAYVGGSFEQTLDLAQSFAGNSSLMSNKELIGTGAIAQFRDAYTKFGTALEQAMKLPKEQQGDAIQESIGELKMSMVPVLGKAKNIVFAKEGQNSAGYELLNNFSKELDEYSRLYRASPEELQETIKSYEDQDKKFAVAYKKADWTSKSQNAKTRLRANGAYTNFMNVIAEANPDMKGLIGKMMNDTTVSPEEEKLIEEKFIGQYYGELFQARAQAIKDFGPSAAAWFKDFDEILEVKKEINKSRMDDIIEGINVPSNPQMKQLNFTLSNGY